MAEIRQTGELVLPEYQNLDQIFNTLCDRVRINGCAQMGSFLVTDEVGGLMVIAPMEQLTRISRLIATISASPIIKGGIGH